MRLVLHFVLSLFMMYNADLAQPIERLICNERGGGLNPSVGTIRMVHEDALGHREAERGN